MAILLDGSNLTTNGLINSATAQASTSGTVITFANIPVGAKRITVMYNGVSTSGTSNLLLQVGAGSVQTTGYLGTWAYTGVSAASGNVPTNGFALASLVTAASLFHGSSVLVLNSANTWEYSQSVGRSDTGQIYSCAGGVTLSGTLDRVVITTVNGTDTFDAGSINILYE